MYDISLGIICLTRIICEDDVGIIIAKFEFTIRLNGFRKTQQKMLVNCMYIVYQTPLAYNIVKN